jgi:microcystin-dependent protein
MGLGKSSVVGQVIMWAGSLASISGEQEPVSGWVLCNGVALAKTGKYASLFNAIGGTYGSDVSNFNVPNLQGRFPIGKSGTYALAATGGAETVTLSLSQIASHTHSTASFGTGSLGAHTHGTNATATTAQNHTHRNILPTKVIQQGSSGSSINAYSTSTGTLVENSVQYGDITTHGKTHTHTVTPNTTGAHTHAVTTGAAGSGGSHNNMPPFASVHFLIRY